MDNGSGVDNKRDYQEEAKAAVKHIKAKSPNLVVAPKEEAVLTDYIAFLQERFDPKKKE